MFFNVCWHSRPFPLSADWRKSDSSVDGEPQGNRPFAPRGHVTSFSFMKIKVIWFCLQKTISGSYLKRTNSDLVFQTRTIFLKWVSSQLIAWPKCDFWNYEWSLSKQEFSLKLQGNWWKDDVVTFSVHLKVTIKRLTRYKQKVVLAAMLEGKSMPSNMAANTNHTTLLKDQSAINYPLKLRV